MAGTNYNAEYNDLVKISLTDESNHATQAECVGDPNTVALDVNVYTNGCIMRRTDTGTGNVLYSNTGTLSIPSWTLIGAGGGGTPSLPFNSIQYNNAGVFGGDSEATRDPSTHFTNIQSTFPAIGFPVFAGVGLDDARFGGLYTGPVATTYVITIASSGLPDTFDWTCSTGGGALGVAITGGTQLLNNGFGLQFGATTGHTVGDSWTLSTVDIQAGLFTGDLLGQINASGNYFFDSVNNIAGINALGPTGGIGPYNAIYGIVSFVGAFQAFSNYDWDGTDAHIDFRTTNLLSQVGMALDSTVGIQFQYGGGNNYTFPKVKATVAGQVLTDVLANGTLSWQSPSSNTLTQHYVGFGSAGNTLTGSQNFQWTESSKFLIVGDLLNSVNGTKFELIDSSQQIDAITDGTFNVYAVSAGGRSFTTKTSNMSTTIGDVDNIINKTKFTVADNVKTITGTIDSGIFQITDLAVNPFLYINDSIATRTYSIGDLNGTNNATGVKITDNAGNVQIGDIFGNNLQLNVNKTNNTATVSTATQIALALDIPNGLYGMGDTLQIANGTRFFLFDTLNKMDFQCKGESRFGDIDNLGNSTKFIIDDVTNRTYLTNSTLGLFGYTVASLPAGTVGDTAYVTDALAPAWHVAVVGGGAVKTPVFYDGANWIVI